MELSCLAHHQISKPSMRTKRTECAAGIRRGPITPTGHTHFARRIHLGGVFLHSTLLVASIYKHAFFFWEAGSHCFSLSLKVSLTHLVQTAQGCRWRGLG